MRITSFFNEILGARLTNTQWSWGGESEISRVLFFRVWRDQISPDGKRVQVGWPQMQSGLGGKERGNHLNALREGRPTFGIVCDAVRIVNDGSKRTIKSYDADSFLRLGVPVDEDKEGVLWATILGRVDRTSALAENGEISSITQDITEIGGRKIGETSKRRLIDARLGQGQFRSDVLSLWGSCCSVTGSTTQEAIRASHILPWRCSTDRERLDPDNGLPLNASIDALFDRYLVSFADSGEMLVSEALSTKERSVLGLVSRKLRKPLSPKCKAYLAHHRKIFEGLEVDRSLARGSR